MEKRNNILLRIIAGAAGRVVLTWSVIAAVIVAAIVGITMLLRTAKDSTTRIVTDDKIDITPTQIASLKAIGQWEFLTISDEEMVDTVRHGIFSDDELVRIYYGTLRLGIDMADAADDWIAHHGDTIVVTLPPVRLLDDDFIDEARTRPFLEKGKWSNADRAALYTRARQIMKRRCLSASNLRSAELNATTQFGHIMRSMGFANVRVRVSRTDKRNNK
ncbi:MAG: DUF4230 domain-containing protein [Prevotella sp.]|nr:DUF4230 domain-containing protein [Prevotella sp.]